MLAAGLVPVARAGSGKSAPSSRTRRGIRVQVFGAQHPLAPGSWTKRLGRRGPLPHPPPLSALGCRRWLRSVLRRQRPVRAGEAATAATADAAMFTAKTVGLTR